MKRVNLVVFTMSLKCNRKIGFKRNLNDLSIDEVEIGTSTF